MKQHEKLRILREQGFAFVRIARHGSLYRDNQGNSILLPRPSTKDPHADKNWVQVFKRIKRRQTAETK